MHNLLDLFFPTLDIVAFQTYLHVDLTTVLLFEGQGFLYITRQFVHRHRHLRVIRLRVYMQKRHMIR
ncbi:hypothetical protein D3C77_566920 [compost metagenome]